MSRSRLVGMSDAGVSTQATRSRLQRFVTDTRRILEEEFTRQLQNDYGMDPASGNVTPIENLRHINDQQRETARIMRDTSAPLLRQPGTERSVRFGSYRARAGLYRA